MSPSSSHPRGAPLGNWWPALGAPIPTQQAVGPTVGTSLKHGFYTRRLKKRDLTGVENTDSENLVDEIAIVRVFTRRLIESLDPEADAYQVASALRILCVALTTITRAMKVQHWISQNNSGLDEAIATAIREVNEELGTCVSDSAIARNASAGQIPPTGGPENSLPPTS